MHEIDFQGLQPSRTCLLSEQRWLDIEDEGNLLSVPRGARIISEVSSAPILEVGGGMRFLPWPLLPWRCQEYSSSAAKLSSWPTDTVRILSSV